MDSIFFLDSWGSVWETCSPDDNDALAFGPTGCARKVPSDLYSTTWEVDVLAGFTIVGIS